VALGGCLHVACGVALVGGCTAAVAGQHQHAVRCRVDSWRRCVERKGSPERTVGGCEWRTAHEQGSGCTVLARHAHWSSPPSVTTSCQISGWGMMNCRGAGRAGRRTTAKTCMQAAGLWYSMPQAPLDGAAANTGTQCDRMHSLEPANQTPAPPTCFIMRLPNERLTANTPPTRHVPAHTTAPPAPAGGSAGHDGWVACQGRQVGGWRRFACDVAAIARQQGDHEQPQQWGDGPTPTLDAPPLVGPVWLVVF